MSARFTIFAATALFVLGLHLVDKIAAGIEQCRVEHICPRSGQ